MRETWELESTFIPLGKEFYSEGYRSQKAKEHVYTLWDSLVFP